MPTPITPITHVYEVVDASDEEQYFTLGVFIDEKVAREQLDSAEPPSNDFGNDSVTLIVRKRALGWRPHELGEVIAQRTWTREYPEEATDPLWSCNPPRQHSFA